VKFGNARVAGQVDPSQGQEVEPTPGRRSRLRAAAIVGIFMLSLASACGEAGGGNEEGGETTVVIPPSGSSSTPDESAAAPSQSQSSVPTAEVTFDEPSESAVVRPGSSIKLSGAISGLAGGQELWVLSRADSADQLYYLTIQAPVATSDGPWSVTDEGVGDASDIGHSRNYIAVNADSACVDALVSVQADADGVLSLPRLPSPCKTIGSPRGVKFA
jgi:hypothetical protein